MSWREWTRDLRFTAGIVRRRPFQVLLQLTNRCNMTCDMCDFWPHTASRDEELSLDDYRRLREELSALGTFLVSIEGGEPFLRDDLVDIVRLFAHGHLPTLYTNGWFVTAESARDLFDAGLTQVGVSIDYPDAARHDAKRGLPGSFDRAWRAVDAFRDAAAHGGRQVHVMTVLMDDNHEDLEALLRASAERRVGHSITLISTTGFRRGDGGGLPTTPVSEKLLRLWKDYPHFKIFREYLEGMDGFLSGGALPECHAGARSFNIDHIGNVASCIERIDRVVGNVREEPIRTIWRRLAACNDARGCQECWTACRGFVQALGGSLRLGNLRDLTTRMRST